MTEHLPRSIEQIVEDQARRWTLVQPREGSALRRPVITVSRQHGAGGGEVARRLALELRLDFFDREILAEISKSAHASVRAVSTMDEKDRGVFSDWLVSFASEEHLSSAAYGAHLSRVIGAIASHGGAVILGRGAHLLLGSEKALRIFVVAPLEVRVAEVSRREGLREGEARRRITAVEAERRAFLARHFHVGFPDLSTFDLVVNTGVIGVAGAVATARSAAEALPQAASGVLVRGTA